MVDCRSTGAAALTAFAAGATISAEADDRDSAVMRNLLSMPHVTVEDRATVLQALSRSDAGIDLADAMHHAS